jgi:Uma2 family endonuclease
MSVESVADQILKKEDLFFAENQPPTDLIFDDGAEMESNRHRIGMNVLIRSLEQGFAHRNDFFAGGNMFIYFSAEQLRNRDFRGQDFFAVMDVDGTPTRQGWVVWQENGRYPDVIVELLSPSTANADKGIKKDIYERVFRTPDYFIFDPLLLTNNTKSSF